MKKFKATIYIPLGYNNMNLNDENQIKKYMIKKLPKKFEIGEVLDTHVDSNYSSVTLEVGDFEDNIDHTKSVIFNFISEKVEKCKNQKLKNELEEIIDFINNIKH